VWVINKAWYGKLGPGQKKVIDDHCTNEWAHKLGVEWGADEDSGKEPLSKDGHTIVKLSPEQMAVWRRAAAPVYDKWIADANKAGYDGKAVLEDLRAELKKRNALQ